MNVRKLLESLRKCNEKEIEDVLRKKNQIAFDNGVVLGVEYKNGKLYAGSITNTGITHDYEIDYDDDSSVDSNLQALYDTIIEEHPEYLGESTKVNESDLGDNVTSDPYHNELADLVKAENEAIADYDKAIAKFNESTLPNKDDIIARLDHIRAEELEHVRELQEISGLVNSAFEVVDNGDITEPSSDEPVETEEVEVDED